MFRLLVDDQQIVSTAPAARFCNSGYLGPVSVEVLVCSVGRQASHWVVVLPPIVGDDVSDLFMGTICGVRHADHLVKNVVDP